MDAERLALRLRLGEGWQSLLGEDVSSAHSSLVSEGKLQENQDQAAAVKALARLPDALHAARGAKSRWDAEQARLTTVAKEKEGRVSQEQRENAAAWTSSWMSRAPSTPFLPTNGWTSLLASAGTSSGSLSCWLLCLWHCRHRKKYCDGSFLPNLL